MGVQRLHLVVGGRVQGVFFRQSTLEEAGRLGLTGWVRNLRAGGVEVLAEGDSAALAQLERWCRRGPPRAEVTGVESGSSAATGEFTHFRILGT